VVAGLEGARDVPQCLAPIGDDVGNGEGQTRGKAGGAAPEEGAVDSAGVEGVTTARLVPSEEALEQVLQECEQDMAETDEALSDIRVGVSAGKRKRGEELAHKHVMHSLWEQGSLEAYNELLFGCLDDEVEALQQSKAEYDEARRLSDGSDSCWSYSGSDSGIEAGLEVGIGSLPLGGAVEEV
jgi:hypothetical protein